jgi:hypothetical protein
MTDALTTPPQVVGRIDPHKVDSQSGGISDKGEVSDQITYKVLTLTEAATYDFGAHELGIPESSRTWNLDGAWYLVTVNYKGFLDAEDSNQYEMDVSFSEEAIEAHPNLAAIKKKYAGTTNEEGKVKFPEFVRAKSGSGLTDRTYRTKNPMFGVTTYLALKAVFRHTYSSKSAPDLNNIGKIVKSVPGNFPTPKDHDWMMMPPKFHKEGRKGDYKVTQEYMGSAPGGWPESVYGLMVS